MKILATGEAVRLAELKQKLSSGFDLTVIEHAALNGSNLNDFDLIFDLNFDEHASLDVYASFTGKALFLGAVRLQLAALPCYRLNTLVLGLNSLPTFLNRPLAELSLADKNREPELKTLMQELGWEYRLVNDRVGMVTPRLVFMIMNEAFYTVQEGTASKQDIDLGMKLGTNYPMGPFEWAEKAGIKNVYECLEALYQDTHDERYKVCPMLKTEYLKSMAAQA